MSEYPTACLSRINPQHGQQPFGAVAMAAYQPDPKLFERQLLSIQAQTYRNYVCLISADGNWQDIQTAVHRIVRADPRFQVLGFDERLGFYGNFERVLERVPSSAEWIALSDQDDSWNPEKLATLVPRLKADHLVSSQARVVEWPSGALLAATTDRRNANVKHFFVENQFTGGAMIFRRTVLDVALPFPRLATPSEVHDHWLAVCAASLGRCTILNDVLQDYVQHGANVIGEAPTGLNPANSVRNILKISRKYEGGTSMTAMLRAIYNVGAGWREVMAEELLQRRPRLPDQLEQAIDLYGSRRRYWRTAWNVLVGWRSGEISQRAALEYLAGGPCKLLLGIFGPPQSSGHSNRW